MILTFCGHAEIVGHEQLAAELEKAITDFLRQTDEKQISFYCGGYGDFDKIASRAVDQIKKDFPDRNVEKIYRGPLIIRRETEREGFFRQTKQKSARVVAPTRRIFVQYDGIKHRDSVHDEYLEVPYITPYLNVDPRQLPEIRKHYDDIIYPPIENTPLKFAVSKRNEWMVDQSDAVFAYVRRVLGGACKTLSYAKRKKKQIIAL